MSLLMLKRQLHLLQSPTRLQVLLQDEASMRDIIRYLESSHYQFSFQHAHQMIQLTIKK